MTKEQDFKTRFIAVLTDLQQNGVKDNETMWLIGSLASGLANDLGSPDWPSARRAMPAATYDTLLQTFQTQGNAHHQEGRIKQAYAIQLLAISLIARSQNGDPQIATGEVLLDEIIDATVFAYRKQQTASAN